MKDLKSKRNCTKTLEVYTLQEVTTFIVCILKEEGLKSGESSSHLNNLAIEKQITSKKKWNKEEKQQKQKLRKENKFTIERNQQRPKKLLLVSLMKRIISKANQEKREKEKEPTLGNKKGKLLKILQIFKDSKRIL